MADSEVRRKFADMFYRSAHVKVGDDGVSIAASNLHGEENEFQFRLRPTLPGSYRILPAQAFPMYDPDHQAHSPPFLLEVVDAE